MQQQEKLKQKMHDQQQQQQQQHAIVPLTPESVARFLASQSQPPPPSEQPHPWSIHHSISAPTFSTYTDQNCYETCHSVD